MCASVDPLVMSLDGWFQDIMAYNNAEPGSQFPFPIIADDRRELVERLGMLDPEEKDCSGMPLSARCVSAPFINTGQELVWKEFGAFLFSTRGQ